MKVHVLNEYVCYTLNSYLPSHACQLNSPCCLKRCLRRVVVLFVDFKELQLWIQDWFGTRDRSWYVHEINFLKTHD